MEEKKKLVAGKNISYFDRTGLKETKNEKKKRPLRDQIEYIVP